MQPDTDQPIEPTAPMQKTASRGIAHKFAFLIVLAAIAAQLLAVWVNIHAVIIGDGRLWLIIFLLLAIYAAATSSLIAALYYFHLARKPVSPRRARLKRMYLAIIWLPILTLPLSGMINLPFLEKSPQQREDAYEQWEEDEYVRQLTNEERKAFAEGEAHAKNAPIGTPSVCDPMAPPGAFQRGCHSYVRKHLRP